MTIMNENKPSLDEVLEHHGIKGMKWGVRQGGVRSRIKGAVDDSMQRRITTAKAVATGNAKGRDRFRSTVFTFAGWTQSKKLANRRVSVLENRQARINSGHAKVTDILAQVGHVTPADLVISRRDARGVDATKNANNVRAVAKAQAQSVSARAVTESNKARQQLQARK